MSLSLEPTENPPIAYKYSQHNKRPIFIKKEKFDFDNATIEKLSDKINVLKLDKPADYFFPAIPDVNPINKEFNCRIYISGASGVGKSFYFIRPYVIAFKKKFPNSKIFLFSSKTDDKALDDLPIQRITINDKFIDNPPSLVSFKSKNEPSLIIFDDIETYTGGAKQGAVYNKAVLNFLKEVMMNGRSQTIGCLYVWHKIADRANTAKMILERTACVVFPNSDLSEEATNLYFFHNYLKITDSKIISFLSNAPSKYVYISKTKPICAISNNYIKILK